MGVLAAPMPDVEVAVAVRRYLPPGQHSRHRLFLAAKDGRLREVPGTRGDVQWPIGWVDDRTVMWAESDRAGYRLKTYRLDTRRTRLVRESRETISLIRHATGPFRGRLVGVEVGSRAFRLRAGQIDDAPPLEEPRLDVRKTVLVPGAGRFSYSSPFDDDPPQLNGQPWRGALPGGVYQAWAGPAGFLVHAFRGGGSGGDEEWLYRLSGPEARPTKLIGPYSGIDVRQYGTVWAALSPGRPLSPYGRGKQVWTSEAYLGDLRTGKRVTLVRGLAFATAIAVRPARVGAHR